VVEYVIFVKTVNYVCALNAGDFILITEQTRAAVFKYTLDNGLTLLVYPLRTTPKVSAQMWYHVGSKDERTGEKGLAHFLEHMLFKGTGHLAESDINVLTHKLAGYCNAFTSYDTTMYLFDMPAQHWHEVLPLFADCMRNARLDEEHLNSELKAVIQELKMYRDDYNGYLFEELVSTIFAEHPYHYPIIGFKQDLWSLDRQALLNFYQTHYIPNNATLVIVGDVNPQEVLQHVIKVLGVIPGNPSYAKQKFYWNEDIVAKSLVMQRAVENPTALCSWVIPGLHACTEYTATFINWLLAQGRGSRLYRKIVDELQLATDVNSFIHNFFDYGLFTLEFQLTDLAHFDSIKQLVAQEISLLIHEGWTEKEELRARKKIEVDYLSLFESPQKLGMAIGEIYLATGQEQYVLEFLDKGAQCKESIIKDFLRYYLRPTVMHTAILQPITQEEQACLDLLQNASDEIDARVLQAKIRTAEIEPARYAHNIHAQPPHPFKAPRGQSVMLANGLTVLCYHNPQLPMIEVVLDLKTKHYYDPYDLQGLSVCTSQMIMEETQHYTAHELALELESYGISLSIDPGCISMTVLKNDLVKGLGFLREVLMNATLPEEALEKVKQRIYSDLDAYWDEPLEFINQLVREELYKNHPYSKHILGNHETIERITHYDVVHWYQETYVPDGATIVIVGDIAQYNIPELIQDQLGYWQGPKAPHITYPCLPEIKQDVVKYPIKRDQIVVCFAGLSVSRMHPDYDKLLLFDQIFGGGVLNSMNSRLFMLREESGLFYTIKGSLIAACDEQTGMVLVKTMVSNDRLQEAVNQIKHTIDTAVDTVTDEEFNHAKQILSNALIENFATNQQTAASLLFLKRYGLSVDYFDSRFEVYNAITKQEMIHAVKRYLASKKMMCIQVGRIDEE
jgi:zinc protease